MKNMPIDQTCIEKMQSYAFPETLLSTCSHVRFNSGETVIRQGDELNWLGIVLDGQAKVYATASNGKDLNLLRYVSEGLIGDMEFAADVATAASTIVAVTDFSFLRFPNHVCKTVLKSHAPFLNLLAARLAEKLLQSAGAYQSGVLLSGEERLCDYVLQNAHGNLFAEVLTDVSASNGVSYRHLFRLFAGLCADGILEKSESGYRILDRHRLLCRAEKSPLRPAAGTGCPMSGESHG